MSSKENQIRAIQYKLPGLFALWGELVQIRDYEILAGVYNQWMTDRILTPAESLTDVSDEVAGPSNSAWIIEQCEWQLNADRVGGSLTLNRGSDDLTMTIKTKQPASITAILKRDETENTDALDAEVLENVHNELILLTTSVTNLIHFIHEVRSVPQNAQNNQL